MLITAQMSFSWGKNNVFDTIVVVSLVSTTTDHCSNFITWLGRNNGARWANMNDKVQGDSGGVCNAMCMNNGSAAETR